MNTPQDSHSGLLLCAFADEGEKKRSIWYSCAVRAELWLFVCAVPPVRTEVIYHNGLNGLNNNKMRHE